MFKFQILLTKTIISPSTTNQMMKNGWYTTMFIAEDSGLIIIYWQWSLISMEKLIRCVGWNSWGLIRLDSLKRNETINAYLLFQQEHSILNFYVSITLVSRKICVSFLTIHTAYPKSLPKNAGKNLKRVSLYYTNQAYVIDV